jgi:hypothetical protein
VLAMGLDTVLARVLAPAQAAVAALVLATVDAGVPAVACRSQGGSNYLAGAVVLSDTNAAYKGASPELHMSTSTCLLCSLPREIALCDYDNLTSEMGRRQRCQTLRVMDDTGKRGAVTIC